MDWETIPRSTYDEDAYSTDTAIEVVDRVELARAAIQDGRDAACEAWSVGGETVLRDAFYEGRRCNEAVVDACLEAEHETLYRAGFGLGWEAFLRCDEANTDPDRLARWES